MVDCQNSRYPRCVMGKTNAADFFRYNMDDLYDGLL